MNAALVSEATKSAPPAAVVVTAAASGFSLNNIIGAVTLLYLSLQIGYLLWKWRNERNERKNRQADRKPS